MTITINKDIGRGELIRQILTIMLPKIRFTESALSLLRIITFNLPHHLQYPFSNVAMRDIERASEGDEKLSNDKSDYLTHRKIKLVKNELYRNSLLSSEDDFKLRKELELLLRNLQNTKENITIQFNYAIKDVPVSDTGDDEIV